MTNPWYCSSGRPSSGSLPSEVGEPSRRQQPACSWWCGGDRWMAHCIGARTELSTSTRRRPASRPGPPAAPPLHGVVPGPPANVERHDAGPKGIAASAYGVPCSWTWTDPHTRQRPSSPTPARADWSRALGWPADALSRHGRRRSARLVRFFSASAGGHSPLRLHPAAGRHIGLHGRRKTKAHQETHLATPPRFYNAGGK